LKPAIRKGPWKWIAARPALFAKSKRGELGPAAAELHKLAGELSETANLAARRPELALDLALVWNLAPRIWDFPDGAVAELRTAV
jgi:hypothetical protein